MCHPGVRWREAPKYDVVVDGSIGGSAVEKAAMGVSRRGVSSQCRQHRTESGRGEELASTSEEEDEDVAAMLGFGSFGKKKRRC